MYEDWLNNSTSTEAPPSPGMTKRMHVSPSGSLEDVALEGSVPSLPCPQVAEAGSGDAVRWGKKAKLLPKCSQHAEDFGNVVDDPSATNDPP